MLRKYIMKRHHAFSCNKKDIKKKRIDFGKRRRMGKEKDFVALC